MINKQLTCNLCRGEMVPYVGPRYSRKVGGTMIVAGAVSTFFIFGGIVGIPLALAGLYMTAAKRQLWVCKDCHTAIERIEIAPRRIQQAQ